MELGIQIKQKQVVLRGEDKTSTLFIPKLMGKTEISSFQHYSVPFWQLQHKEKPYSKAAGMETKRTCSASNTEPG